MYYRFLQKYDIGTFDDFCDELGYSNDSINAQKTYFACQKEYSELTRLFSQKEMEDLQEIQ